MVSPTSSPSPLRNSPGFPPGSPRPHRGRTMHATQISTCARNSRRAVPPTPCRSRPPAPCRRRVGHVERCSTWTWGCGRGSTSHPRGNSVRQDTPCHATWQAPRSPTHLPRRRTGHAPHCRQNSPRRTGHGNWLAPPMRRGRSQEATTAKTVDAADERMRTRSRHRNVPRDAWYFAPPWYFGSTRPSVPRPVADPTVSNTSATNVSSYAGHSSTWTCRARSEAVLRTPVVFRFDKPPRATPRGKPHDPQHICHRIAGPRPARQTGPPPHPGPRTLSLTLRNLQCK